MTTQPEALRLAKLLMGWGAEATQLERQASTELRRLHAVNAELLEALEDIAAYYPNSWAADTARAAIAKATGEKA